MTDPKAYKVLSIDELMRPSDTGGVEKYYRHKIKTGGGVILTIDIEERDFTEAKTAPILLKKATEADKILSL